MLRRFTNLADGAIVAELSAQNAERTNPPLDDEEIDGIIANALVMPRQVPTWAEVNALDLLPSHRRVFLALFMGVTRMGEVTISLPTLAAQANVSASTAGRALAILERKNVLTSRQRYNGSNRYTISPVDQWRAGR